MKIFLWILRLILVSILFGVFIIKPPNCAQVVDGVKPYMVTDEKDLDPFFAWQDDVMEKYVTIHGWRKQLGQWLDDLHRYCSSEKVIKDGYARKIYLNPAYLPDEEPYLRMQYIVIIGDLVLIVITFIPGEKKRSRAYA